ncbi:MAG: FecR domain-containing protein [Candidatus Riflebacteria bacterium]|nr:FecR domain-containing protein [Candidatus Riflebacteria bacterium]
MTRSPVILCLLSLVACLLLSACGSHPGSPGSLAQAKDLPAVEGNAECRLVNDSSPVIRVTRRDRTLDLAAPRELPFFANDRLENTSPEIIRLACLSDEATFAVKPRSRLDFQVKSLVLQEGQVRMEFTKVKGVFRIRLPGAVLAIRGTSLEVTVNPDKTSNVALLEGTIGIIGPDGQEKPMEAGQQAAIPATPGGNVQISPLGDIKGSFDDLSEDKAIKTIR